MPFSGSAPNKSYSRDTGVYSGATSWQQTDSGGRGIRADDADTHDQDMAAAINTSLQKNGDNKPTANLDWGGFGIVNAGIYGFSTTASVTSAATTDILGATSVAVNVTGSTGPITSFGTGTNRWRFVHFASTPTITHNATSLILPTGADITAAAGDTALIISDASSNVRVVMYQRASGAALGGTVGIAQGGTGQTSATAAFAALAANAVAFTGDITPTILSADANNYSPTGASTSSIWRVSANSTAWSITGIAGGTDGRILVLVNIGANLITIPDSSGSSDAANQIVTVNGAWTQLPGYGAIILAYDATQSKWIVVADRPPLASQSDQETGTALNYVSTSVQQYHKSAVKCWGEFLANSTTVETSYNITSVADTATGQMTVTIAADFSSVDWPCLIGRAEDDLTLVYSVTYNAKDAGSVVLHSVVEAGGGSDPSSSSGNATWSMLGMGDI